MGSQAYERKLTAILSADVAGYSRLMGEDDEATVSTLTGHRRMMVSLIEQHRGRVVDSPGDNLLAEFSSVLNAVNCAAEIQREFAERNAELPEDRRMEFRIGVNVGEVIKEGDRIYGDGVNIAARLESLAEPGGICISGFVYNQVKNRLKLEYEFIGEQSVKNIKEPVPVHRVLSFPGAAAHRVIKARKDAEKVSMGPSLMDKPSIAVLPFVNMSGDPEQEYFSDGLTDEIINGLSNVPKLFVIARNSTFTYKGKPVKVQQVSEELGVRYVLEGSVRKAGDRVRITAQLIEATTGHHLWSERYERELRDIFVLQDEITKKILTALQVKLTHGEVARVLAKSTNNFEAYLKYLQTLELLWQPTREGIGRARQLLEEAIALDPKYSEAHRLIGFTHWYDVFLGSSKSPGDSLETAMKMVQKAITLDESNAAAYGTLGMILAIKREYDEAITAAQRGYELEPNSSPVLVMYAYILDSVGRTQEAIQLYEEAIRLEPIPANVLLRAYAESLIRAKRYDEAITLLKRAIEQEPSDPFAHIHITQCYWLSGRKEEARAEAVEVLRLDPKFSVEKFARTRPDKDRVKLKKIMDALREAGLPD